MGKSITKKAKNFDGKGLKVTRYFSKEETNVFDLFNYENRSSVIRNPSGDAVFEMNDVEVPATWSQVATDILAQKYFRKAGVPLEMDQPGPKKALNRWRIVWPTAGKTGVHVMAILLRSRMPIYFTTK
jgi:ribonucleoside-diphosphate reductase alpha chain